MTLFYKALEFEKQSRSVGNKLQHFALSNLSSGLDSVEKYVNKPTRYARHHYPEAWNNAKWLIPSTVGASPSPAAKMISAGLNFPANYDAGEAALAGDYPSAAANLGNHALMAVPGAVGLTGKAAKGVPGARAIANKAPNWLRFTGRHTGPLVTGAAYDTALTGFADQTPSTAANVNIDNTQRQRVAEALHRIRLGNPRYDATRFYEQSNDQYKYVPRNQVDSTPDEVFDNNLMDNVDRTILDIGENEVKELVDAGLIDQRYENPENRGWLVDSLKRHDEQVRKQFPNAQTMRTPGGNIDKGVPDAGLMDDQGNPIYQVSAQRRYNDPQAQHLRELQTRALKSQGLTENQILNYQDQKYLDRSQLENSQETVQGDQVVPDTETVEGPKVDPIEGTNTSIPKSDGVKDLIGKLALAGSGAGLLTMAYLASQRKKDEEEEELRNA